MQPVKVNWKQLSAVRGTEGLTVALKTNVAVHKGGHVKRKSLTFPKNKPENTQSSTQRSTKSSKECKGCGKSPSHTHSMCPARNAKHLKFKKKGYYRGGSRKTSEGC